VLIFGYAFFVAFLKNKYVSFFAKES